MATTTGSTARLRQWLQSVSKKDSWCIVINADPDALSSALALKRILRYRVGDVCIARINTITRPDNLAMIRYLRIPVVEWTPEVRERCTRFAMVDSQPHHNAAFAGVTYSLVIDHHPLSPENPLDGEYIDIRTEYGATASIMSSYLHNLGIKPGRLLATALLYGIRTDTGAFLRSGGELDLRAYRWLTRHAAQPLLMRIQNSEYLLGWLPLFSRAFRSLTTRGSQALAYVGEVSSPDLLVAIADFFTHVHGLRWLAVGGVANKTLVVIFRGDGTRDLGRYANQCFGDVGSAGGHRALARAEVPLEALNGAKPGDFVRQRLKMPEAAPAKPR